jgi:magnesium transporter
MPYAPTAGGQALARPKERVDSLIKFYKTVGEELLVCDAYEEGVWIDLVNPSEDEISRVVEASGIDAEMIRPALDEEERSHIEIENGQTLILVDAPLIETEGGKTTYSTIPLGIVLTKSCILTVCLKDTAVLSEFTKKRVKAFYTQYKSRFLLQILYKNATLYLIYLRQIEKLSNKLENDLQKSMKNKELTQLLQLEKSLVYFSTSLKSNESVLEKLLKLEAIRKFEDDQELLEDVIIENKQAIEMTNIYSSILSGTMDAFASVISNNLNIVMKSLTIITISLAIPSMVSGFFGMNVRIPWGNTPLAFPLIVGASALLALLTSFALLKKKLF